MVAAAADISRPIHTVRMRYDVKVPMRDGVNLSTDVYLPEAEGEFPDRRRGLQMLPQET